MKKYIATTLAGLTMALGTFAVAQAVEESAGGGTWQHGVTNGRVYSNYFHGSKCHGSKVVGKTTAYSGNIIPGYWARVGADARWWVADQAYWNYC